MILDGATGSNLQAAGMKIGVCPEQWILQNPDVLLSLQREYVKAAVKQELPSVGLCHIMSARFPHM